MTDRSIVPLNETRIALGIMLLSGSILALEILFVRFVSILLYPVATYLVISLALLGLGASGGALSLRDARKFTPQSAGYAAIGFSIATLFSLIAIWFAGTSARVAILLPVALAAPMFFAGLAVSTAFSLPRIKIPVLYFADLIGAGAAAGLVLLSLNYLSAIQVTLLVAAIGLMSALLFLKPRRWLLGLPLLLGILGLSAFSPNLPHGVSPIAPKELRLMLGLGDGVSWEYQGWSPLARVDVLSLAGDALIEVEDIPYKLVTHDGGAPSLLLRLDGERAEKAIVENSVFGVPYWVKEKPEVMVIGLGGGPDVITALAADAESVLGAEVNPEMIAIVRDQFADFTGDPYSDPKVEIALVDGRHLLASTERRFDIIQLTGVDTTIASLGGNPNLAENYLYTREAFIGYLRHLSHGGVLSVSFPRVEGLGLRLLALASEALEAHGIQSAGDHVIVSEMTGYVHVLIKKQPFTPQEVSIIRSHFDNEPTSVYFPLYHRLFGRPDEEFIAGSRILFAPGIEAENVYVKFLQARQAGNGDRYLADFPYTVEPPKDDWPFFFVLDKWGHQTNNYDILLLTLWILLIVSFALMLLPPFLLRRRGLRLKNGWALAAYFSLLGLGFIFVEVTLIQKLTLIVGHPSYALTVTLSSLLVSSGLGSYLSSKIAWPVTRKASLAAIGVAILILITHLILNQFRGEMLSFPLFVRILTAGMAVGLPGILMGVPFPSGLTLVKDVEPNFVPWAWGLNSTFTVMGTILGLLLAMSFGFVLVLGIAAAIYIGATISIQLFSASN